MPEFGKTISHYRIVEKIGQGGMGEVYLADDTTLDRKVALKFLPEAFTSDPERMARFEREAKLLASLNHPNIAGIYGLEQADGNRFLVLEYVEGETLQARLSKGALPLEEALELCRQIAEGLEAAHEKGVIHRDLKPANVMITADEKVKILDFGLAKAFSDDNQSIDSSQSPTLTEAMTQPGVILGTAAYMSPEQAKGKSVDKRADIWAFGCILYECLTGKRAFEGETVTETLAAILRGEPDWNRLPPNLHPRIRLLLERCLEKHSKDRYGVISDARVDIQKVLADPSGVFIHPISSGKHQTRFQWISPWIAGIVIITAIIAGIIGWSLRNPEPRQVTRFEYELPEGQQISDYFYPTLAVSPDGSQFVYSTSEGLYLRPIDDFEAGLITGTEGHQLMPFFSHDGQSIGYFSLVENSLKKIPVEGGIPKDLCTVTDVPIRPSWGEDDYIVYGQTGKGIMRISAGGGSPEVLLELKDPVFSPQILPDKETVLFTLGGKVMVQKLKSEEPKELFEGVGARYLPSGHILYADGNNLFRRPFDLERLEPTEDPEAAIEGVYGWVTGPQFAVSDSGTLVYIPGAARGATFRSELVWVDRNSNEEVLSEKADDYRGLRISPDGTRLAFSIYFEGKSSIYVYDFERKNKDRLIAVDNSNAASPVWSPDGKRIVFGLGDIPADLYWMAANGTGKIEKLYSIPGRGLRPQCLSDDGNTLVVMEGKGLRVTDIGMLSMEGELLYTPLPTTSDSEHLSRISPDGKWIAYSSSELDQYKVYIRPYPEIDKEYHYVATGRNPLWSPDGRELFYRCDDGIMAVSVQMEPSLKLGNPKFLFKDIYRLVPWADGSAWDIHPITKRFLMIKPEAGAVDEPTTVNPRKINVILNWFE